MNSSSNIWGVLLLFAHKKDHLPHYRGLWQPGIESTSQLLRALHKAYLSRKGRLLICPNHNQQASIHHSPQRDRAHCQPDPLPRGPTDVCALKMKSMTSYAHIFSLASSPPRATPLLHCFCQGRGQILLSLRLQRHHDKLQSYRGLKGRWLPVRRRTVSTACFCGDEITEFRFCIWFYMGFKGNIQ